MRTFANLQVLCSFDFDQLQEAFSQQITFDDTDPSTAAQVQSGLVLLAANAASVPFNFGSVTSADTLLVIAYQECQVQLGSNTAPLVNVRPVPASPAASILSKYQKLSQPGVLFLRGKLGSLFLSNPSLSLTANVFVAVVGNAL
jgi:hypothetical protein